MGSNQSTMRLIRAALPAAVLVAWAPLASAHGGSPYEDPLARLLLWLGKLHVMTVHFPIALLLSAAAAELLSGLTGRDELRVAVRFSLWLAAIAALASAPTGWLVALAAREHDARLLQLHRWSGLFTASWTVVLLVLSERSHRSSGPRGLLRLGLVVGALAVATTGFLGGSLVHGIDHLAWGSQ